MNDPMTPRAMTLREAQSEFTLQTTHLIQFIFSQGFYVTFGDAFRDPRAFGLPGSKITSAPSGVVAPYGKPFSCHKLRLAIDLNLFDAQGRFLTTTDAHREFGVHWERQHFLARWGGRFNDANHYSFEWQGKM